MPRYDELSLRDAGQVRRVLELGCEANLNARCRRGSIDVVVAGDGSSRRLVATGDLHDNPVHLARLVDAAGLYTDSPKHLTLHEVIHGGRLVNDMDFSYRALVRIAALKAANPEHVHALLANHELSQIVGAGIVKDGVNVVRSFNDAVEFTFGDDAKAIQEAIGAFIRSMPLALVCMGNQPALEIANTEADAGVPAGTGSGGGETSSAPHFAAGILCAHSLPAPELMDRFDPSVLGRGLTEEDYVPRRGSAHLMVWGRGHTPEQLEMLANQWGVSLFVLGHEKADEGAIAVPPNAVVLNSDHERGKMLVIDLDAPPGMDEAVVRARPIE